MELFHNSRDIAYRSPYGAIAPGTTVTLAVDVLDAENARVTLRTWVDGEGEVLHEMAPIEVAPRELGPTETIGSPEEAGPDEDNDNGQGATRWERATRYQAAITPEIDGIVWYYFIVTDEQGNSKRYGAQPGRIGGTGQMVDWEPPSFQLTVHVARDIPPAWHEFIGAYLHNQDAEHTLEETVESTRENFPIGAYESAYPWKGDVSTFSRFNVNDEVFGFWSADDAGNALCTLVNASPRDAYDIPVALVADEVTELTSGYGVHVVGENELEALRRNDMYRFCDVVSPEGGTVEAGTASQPHRFGHVHLNQLGACVLHFHATERLQRPMESGVGVLAHITSLPSDEKGMGTLGETAKRFVDGLAKAGVRYWQVLPANPTDDFGSPYAGISAFAGNIRLLEGNGGFLGDPTPTPQVHAKVAKSKKYQKFCKRERDWLEPYAAFMALREKFGAEKTWQEWPKRYRRFNPKVIAGDKELKQAAEAWRQSQYLFEQQWNDLRSYANERGVLIVGDMPIYVSGNSADVWSHPDIFQLDADGKSTAVAGCAPDAFAPEGQVWGNPLYDWDACQASGFDWWLRRLKRAFELYDVVRLDHFIGFSRYFSIPAATDAKPDAKLGTYHRGPGIALFQSAYEQFGPLPVIAEDLGLITPAVRALSDGCGFPGMDIAQFVDGNDPLSGYRPRPGKITYTGTHDNQTLVGYCEQRYPHLNAQEAASDIMKNVATCEAPVCIVPLQDLMGLDDEARMNTPGTTEGNWSWQASADDLPAAFERARELVALHAERAVQ